MWRARSMKACFLASTRVQIFGRVVAEFAEFETFQNVEHFQRGQALRVRRHLVDGVAAIIHADRVDPVRRLVGEIARRVQPAFLLRELDDLGRDLAAIEDVRPSAAIFFSVPARFLLTKISPGAGGLPCGR